MKVELFNKTGEQSPVSSNYAIFENLKNPVCVLGSDGILIYGNKEFIKIFQFDNSESSDLRLDWQHPFFPEYRKRIAQAYLSALNGAEKQCFAIINTHNEKHIPAELYLFPLFENNTVTSILVFIKIVDERLLSFDRSTLSLISEENFQYDNMHFEFSPLPILRINDKLKITRCSHSSEGFLGYTSDEIIEKNNLDLNKIFLFDAERIKKALNDIFEGLLPFHRIGEVKISTREQSEKIINLVMYPIIQNNEIATVEMVFEDITKVKELKDKINTMERIQLLSDITKGFLHSLNNSINVIMSKTQLLTQITEKEPVIDGIHLIEESAQEIINQIRRVQNFIGSEDDSTFLKQEPLVKIIEDAIEFSKIQFKVDDNEKRRTINIVKKYYTDVYIKTNTKLLREIVISILIQVANYIRKKGTLEIDLKENSDLILMVKAQKNNSKDSTLNLENTINIFSGSDIRQVAEKLNIKIIEEESSEYYSVKAIMPKKLLIDAQSKTSTKLNYKLRDLNIMIVEDEVALQKILFEMFDKMGNHVFVCDDGKEALTEFKQNKFDILITDYGIKSISGLELAARVKELNEHTVTILLSGWMLKDLNEYSNIIDKFLPKPFKLDDLLTQLSKIMHKKKNI